MDEEYAVAESPDRAVTRRGRKGHSIMRARILKQHGVLQPGQIISGKPGDLPDGVAEYFEDDDPTIITVREPGGHAGPTMTANGEATPWKDSAFAKSQHAKVDTVAAEHVASVKRTQDAIKTKAEEDKVSAEFQVKTQAAVDAGTPAPAKPYTAAPAEP